MKIDFKGKTAIVTGATRGIGKQIADDLYSLGATVILTGTDPGKMAGLNASAGKGSRRRYLHLDLLNEESIGAFLGTVKRHNKIDVCINNAGTNRLNYVYETTTDDWDAIMKVNLRGPFILTREIGKMMKKRREGRIVNISSLFGVVTKTRRAAYTASKSGLIGFTKTAAIDLAPYNVLVNSVSPGFVLTDLTKRILTKKDIKELRAFIPLGRFGMPEEISKVVLFLASDLNTYITGQNIVADGGYVDI